MNPEIELKLQAHLDGELPAGERRAVAGRLASDAGARALLQELERTRAALAGGEIARVVPETREFYWSKIERELRRQEAASARPTTRRSLAWWRRWLVPVAGMAVVALVISLASLRGPAGRSPHLVEAKLADSGALTYHDSQEGVTLVWLSYPADGNTGESHPGANAQ